MNIIEVMEISTIWVFVIEQLCKFAIFQMDECLDELINVLIFNINLNVHTK